MTSSVTQATVQVRQYVAIRSRCIPPADAVQRRAHACIAHASSLLVAGEDATRLVRASIEGAFNCSSEDVASMGSRAAHTAWAACNITGSARCHLAGNVRRTHMHIPVAAAPGISGEVACAERRVASCRAQAAIPWCRRPARRGQPCMGAGKQAGDGEVEQRLCKHPPAPRAHMQLTTLGYPRGSGPSHLD